MKQLIISAFVAAVAALGPVQAATPEAKATPKEEAGVVKGITPEVFEFEPSVTGDTARLEVYLPEGELKGAVVVCPGGGYAFRSDDKEGRCWVNWFARRGVATAVLLYTMPQGHDAQPLAECSAAMKLMRENAGKWGFPADKIGVMGFSAGGHLASTMATHFTAADRPDFQILFYPVINLYKAKTHKGTRKNLIGENPTEDMVKLYSNHLHVTPQTPPAFIFTCQDDKTVNPDNSLDYYSALTKAKVPSEMHFYPFGGHGFGFTSPFAYRDQMFFLLDAWIRSTVNN